MLRVHSNTKLEGFTEYEEEAILFDPDDPDFVGNTLTNVPIILATVRRNMSLASVHPAEIHSSHSSLATLSHSLEDITTTPTSSWSSSPIPPYLHHHHHHHHHLNYNTINNHNDHVLTIEELRLQMTTCFTCGVSWNDKHVSLDCSECGGYALERPCIECDGKCGALWKRDLSMSHASSKARWQGECSLKQQQSSSTTTTTKTDDGGDDNNKNDDVDRDSRELAAKLEKLSANS